MDMEPVEARVETSQGLKTFAAYEKRIRRSGMLLHMKVLVLYLIG